LLSTVLLLVGGSVVVLVALLLVPLGPVGWVLSGLLMVGAFVAWFGWLMRWGSRAGSVPPRPGRPPVASDEVLARLDDLSTTGWVQVDVCGSFGRRVRAVGPLERTDELADATVSRTYTREISEFEVTLDGARHRAAVAERTVTTAKGVHVSPLAVGAFWQRNWFRGITLPVYATDDPPALAFDVDRGWRVRTQVGLTSSDLRSALLDVVCSSGWTYAPAFRVGRWTSVPT
jgi:hypothetical protein